jgi:hypothetical protein
VTVAVESTSALSDTLLRQLMAVGQVDVLVGLPTLDNATTVVDIVRAINVSFTRDFPRLRTVMINSDGGSTDGTPDLIRDATVSETDMVLTSHSLRTLHRVVAPYHGLPGRHAALRTVFAAAALTQARALVVVDPAGPTTTAERLTELITPITRADVEFLSPRYRRHPRDGLLVTQLVRPIVRSLYGAALDEPLGVEFSCSGRFASHCLDRDMWDREAARFAIDLWLRTEAAAAGFALGQIWRPITASAGARARLRETVQQVIMALIESLCAHESFWRGANDAGPLRTWGDEPAMRPEAPSWDFEALAGQARGDITQIQPLLDGVLDAGLVAGLMTDVSGPVPRLDDERWVRIVYAIAAATRQGRASVEHLAGMFVPLYLWRAASFMAETSHEADAVVEARLDSLAQTFQRLKPVFVEHWSAAV